jgi:Ethylbenzene dehydrogenase
MIKRIHLQFAALLLVAIALTFFKVPLASSQGVSLVAGWVDGDIPAEDAGSAIWQQTTAVEIPLSAQNVTKPFLLDSKIKSVTARVLQNASQIAVLVEWADSTQDDSTVALQDFRDAVALQFPQVTGQPFFCMGQQGGSVNLWHWKADWQAEITARKEMEAQYPNMYVDYYPFTQAVEGKLAGIADYSDQNYLPAEKAGNLLAAASLKSPVEDLIAGGFGTLTSQPPEEQNVQGFGAWKDGKWQVIFSRSLTSSEADDVSFQPGKTYSVAFAVWDGANKERNGQKSTSQWVSLQLSNPPGSQAAPTQAAAAPQGVATPRNVAYLLFGLLAVLIIIGAFIYIKLPE